jgi:hypothetical protein
MAATNKIRLHIFGHLVPVDVSENREKSLGDPPDIRSPKIGLLKSENVDVVSRG